MNVHRSAWIRWVRWNNGFLKQSSRFVLAITFSLTDHHCFCCFITLLNSSIRKQYIHNVIHFRSSWRLIWHMDRSGYVFWQRWLGFSFGNHHGLRKHPKLLWIDAVLHKGMEWIARRTMDMCVCVQRLRINILRAMHCAWSLSPWRCFYRYW